jgi:hypothetical protein
MQTQNPDPRILIFSQRNASERQPFRCAHFEFEDVIAQIDSVEIVAPSFARLTRRSAFAKQLAYHTPFVLNPGIQRNHFKKEYDLFLAICGDPSDLLAINALGNWRAKCKKAVCVIDEMWIRQIPAYKNYLEMLQKFDVVCLYYSQSPEHLNKIIGPRSMYLPPAVDAIRFSPYPNPPERVVDIYSIGRRSSTAHEALLELAEKRNLYYVHDTTTADHVLDSVQHRRLYSRTLKRSRFFIVNPGLIDRPDVRGNQIEIGYRYFDGIAAGAINVGERPQNEVYPQLFDWPDSMIDFPYNSTEFEKLIQALDKDPEKEAQMRRTNVHQALLRHDWLYRWETVLKAVDLEPLPILMERKARLRDLAQLAISNSSKPAAGRSESGLHAVRSQNG